MSKAMQDLLPLFLMDSIRHRFASIFRSLRCRAGALLLHNLQRRLVLGPGRALGYLAMVSPLPGVRLGRNFCPVDQDRDSALRKGKRSWN